MSGNSRSIAAIFGINWGNFSQYKTVQSFLNKNPRGKPSRLTLDFLVSLGSGVLARMFLSIRPKGRGIKPQEI
jgi:hypothetical protein